MWFIYPLEFTATIYVKIKDSPCISWFIYIAMSNVFARSKNTAIIWVFKIIGIMFRLYKLFQYDISVNTIWKTKHVLKLILIVSVCDQYLTTQIAPCPTSQ